MECVSTRPQKRPADMDAMITRLELSKHILMKERNPRAPKRLRRSFPTRRPASASSGHRNSEFRRR
jgi:hypothetical protein